MLQSRILRFLICFSAVLVAFWAYALLAVPLIEPSVAPRESAAVGTRGSSRGDDRYERLLRGLFPPGAWELESPKILETDQGLLLFKDYQPAEDGRLEVTPFTVVFHSFDKSAGKDGKKQRPMVLSTPTGAILEFDRPIDLGRAEFGKLVSGNLRGGIHIHSPPSSPQADDAMEIRTRDVYLNQNSIKTPYQVDFRIGPHFGKGNDLTIDLTIPQGADDDSDKQTRFGRAKSLQLTHVERIYLFLASDGFLGADEQDGAKKIDATETIPVEITCLGPLHYDFADGIASFEDHVDVIKVNPQGASDQLNCDRLEVRFSQHGSLTNKDAHTDGPGGRKERMKVRRVIATGRPATLRAPSNSAIIVAQRMEFDLLTRQVSLQDGREVQLKHDRDDIRCRQLRYTLGPPRRLGQLDARGPGTFRRADSSGQTEMFAKWERQFTIAPQGNQHLASLQGDTRIEWPDSICEADVVRAWIVEVPREPEGRAGEKRRFKILPTKIEASGGVKFDTPRLAAETQQIDALFEHIASPGQQFVPADGGQRPTNSARNDRFLIGHATAGDEVSQQKFRLTGDRVRARVVQIGDKSSVREVAVVGNVHLRETIVENPGDLPIDVTGQSLHLHRDEQEQARIQVRASSNPQPGEKILPAKVTARELTITAAEVNLEQVSNRIWVDGGGGVTIAAEKQVAASRSAPRTSDGLSSGNRGQSVITWKDRMVFDGKVVHFEGDVVGTGHRILDRGQVQTFATRSRTLAVTLSQFVDFGDQATPKEKAAEIADLKLDGGIVMDSQTYDGTSQLTAMDHVEATDLSVNYLTGALVANGSGYMRSVRRGQPAVASPVGNSADDRPSADTLTYTKVNFQRAVQGNIKDRRFEFFQGIEAVHGPITAWQEQLDANRRDGLGKHGVMITCNQLTVAETGLPAPGQAGQKPVELIAQGSAFATGQGFEAHGNRISMDQTKESIVLEGDTREGARILHQAYPGAPRNRLAAGKIYYSRKTGRVQWQDLTLGEVIQP